MRKRKSAALGLMYARLYSRVGSALADDENYRIEAGQECTLRF